MNRPPDSANRFQSLGFCLGACGKRASGVLYDVHAKPLGNFCEPCAAARITKARVARAELGAVPLTDLSRNGVSDRRGRPA